MIRKGIVVKDLETNKYYTDNLDGVKWSANIHDASHFNDDFDPTRPQYNHDFDLIEELIELRDYTFIPVFRKYIEK